MKIIHHRLCHRDGTPVPYVETANMEGHFQPRFAAIHFTAGPSVSSALNTLTRRRARGNVSAHVVVGRDGEIVQLAPFDRITWHAGQSRWWHEGTVYVGLNQFAIGIELVNAGPLTRVDGENWRAWWGRHYPESEVIESRHPHGGPMRGWMHFPEEQQAAAFAATRTMVRHYGLLDIVGHDDIAPGRKLDPGPAFPMDEFRSRIFGKAAADPAASSEAGPLGRFYLWLSNRRTT